MARTFLLEPGELAKRLQIRYRNQAREWLAGNGSWPLGLGLGPPSEAQALQQRARVLAWQQAWAHWSGPAELRWLEKRWPILGTQRLPESISFPSPEAVAACLGCGEEWNRARRRFEATRSQWPALAGLLPGYFDVLAQWPEEEFGRLAGLLGWLVRHPGSGCYLRQLPVPGVDGKWLETRQKVVRDWLLAIRGTPGGGDLHEVAGLRRLPRRLRVRLLDPALRERAGGLGDVQAPVEDLRSLRLPVQHVLIVENVQTGLAFGDLPGTVVFMGQGYEVEPFGELPWLQSLPCCYWGDLDTHGFVILDRLRHHLPQARALLMDRDTLLAHRALWGEEQSPAKAGDLPRLLPAERELFADLQGNRWGARIRLEQERIEWGYALERTRAALAGSR